MDNPDLYSQKPVEKKDNTLHIRCSEKLYKRVYAISANTGYTMTDVVVACLEQSLGNVDVGLMKARKKP